MSLEYRPPVQQDVIEIFDSDEEQTTRVLSSQGDANDPIVVTDSEDVHKKSNSKKTSTNMVSKKKSPKKKAMVVAQEVEVIEIDD